MLTDIFAQSSSISRLQDGIARAYLDDFTDWLAERSYTESTIRSYVYAAVRLLAWVKTAGYDIPNLNQVSLDGYRKQLVATDLSGNRNGERSNAYCGARRFVLFLQEKGIVENTLGLLAESPPIEAFCHWMRQHRGVTESTLVSYRPVVRMLIRSIGDLPSSFTAGKLRRFVLEQTKDYGRSKAETVVTAVRMFVRYLIATGQCSDCLRYAVPPLAGWRQSSIPRYLDASDVEHIIACCEPSTPLGMRDRAVILLLARLALRASDVAGLRLSDIDWQQGRLFVSGKTRHQAWLPLPQDVGDALLHYLHKGRPSVSGDGLFITTRAPYTPILARQVSQTAQRAILRAGINAPSYGVHIFRHSAATALLRNGVPLQGVATLLRHSSVEMTAHYAKVDVELLKQVALPWPEEAPLC